jgi:hypothetical protein
LRGPAGRRNALAVAVAWVLTRAVLAWLADHPDVYGTSVTRVIGDVELYRAWAASMIRGGLAPYRDVLIEYPPGSLPFIGAPWPWVAAGGAYRTGFIALMLGVDALGLAGVLVLSHRWDGRFGPWAWVGLVTLLGPIAYLRLDVVPAVATIWALERASARAWSTSGAWIGFGALVKLYPGLLLPVLWSRARAPGRLVGGVALVVLAGLAPFLGSLEDLRAGILGYHSERGIQVESSWGLALLAASRAGYPVSVAYDFGAFHVHAGIAPLLEWAALASSTAVLATFLWWSVRARDGLGRTAERTRDGLGRTAERTRDGLGRTAEKTRAPSGVTSVAGALLGMLALLLCTSPVLSPQFLLWVIALGSVAACGGLRGMGPAIAALAAAAVLTQLVYPFAYDRLLARDGAALALLAARNLALGAAGALAVMAARRA